MRMSLEEYYKPSKPEVFEEIKRAAIELWSTFDDTHGYASEKIAKIKDLPNVGDNTGYMVAMFDIFNQRRLLDLVKLQEAQQYIMDLITD